jgi:hypothetical protein
VLLRNVRRSLHRFAHANRHLVKPLRIEDGPCESRARPHDIAIAAAIAYDGEELGRALDMQARRDEQRLGRLDVRAGREDDHELAPAHELELLADPRPLRLARAELELVVTAPRAAYHARVPVCADEQLPMLSHHLDQLAHQPVVRLRLRMGVMRMPMRVRGRACVRV